MIKKICPVCDLPVNELNYCPRCRRVVLRPVVRDVNYYLNERHPAFHTDHQPLHEEKRLNRSVPGPVQSGSQPSARPAAPSANHRTALPSKPNGREKSWTRFILSMTGIIISCVTLSTVSGIFKMGTRIMNSETAVQYDDSGYAELDEEDVIAAGEHCSGYNHFPADGKQITDSMEQFLNGTDYGYTVVSGDVYSDNYEFEDEDGSISYYETIESFTFEDGAADQPDFNDESYVYQYMDINYDTATGELHDYITSLKNQEASLAYLEQFLTLTEAAAGIAPEVSSVPGIMEQAKAGISQEDGAYILDGIFNINIYQEEDAVRIYVTYNDPQAAADQEI